MTPPLTIMALCLSLSLFAQATSESTETKDISMRDKRFVAIHRGGPLDLKRHQLLATWAADCAEHVLPLFEKESFDDRPRKAIEVIRAWVRGEVAVGAAQKAAYAAHAAAKEAKSPAAIAAARSTGQAVATAHFADHSLVAAKCAIQAVEAASGSPQDEYAWQMACIPESVRDLVISGIGQRFPKSVPK